MVSSNTIYIDEATKEVKEANRTTSVDAEAGNKLKLPHLGMVGFTTVLAIDTHKIRRQSRLFYDYTVAMDAYYEKEMIQSGVSNQPIFYDLRVAESIKQLYCDDFPAARNEIERILCHEARNLYAREKFDVLTIATPGFDFALEAIGEELQCETISLSQAIADYCRERQDKLKKIGIFGTPLDIHLDSPLLQKLGWAETVELLPLDLAKQVAFGIEKRLALKVSYGEKSSPFVDYALALANDMQEKCQLDAMIVCNPELHDVALQLRKEWKELEVVDATEMSWQVVDQYFTKAKASAEAETKGT